jgi:hypothetical protein
MTCCRQEPGEERDYMQVRTRNRALWATAALLILLGIAAAIGFGRGSESSGLGGLQAKQRVNERQFETSSQGTANGGSGGEAAESLRASQEWQQPRTAPGIVAPGAYSAAFAQLTGLAPPAARGARSRRSSTTRTTSTTATTTPTRRRLRPRHRPHHGPGRDQGGHVYAAGANGGVWRSSTGGGNWTPIADAIPTLSSGDLQLDQDGALWYATGEANTGGTSYVGNGVYRLTSPTSGSFTINERVGGHRAREHHDQRAALHAHQGVGRDAPRHLVALADDERRRLDVVVRAQPGLHAGRRIGERPERALQEHRQRHRHRPEEREPPDRRGRLAQRRRVQRLLRDDERRVVVDQGQPDRRDQPEGHRQRLLRDAADGSKLYAINQSPGLLNKLTGTVNSYLDGVYVSNNGSPSARGRRSRSRRSSPTPARR